VRAESYFRHIPVFIPHLGCPHRCVFCDQRAISGQTDFSLGGVREQIETALATIRNREQTHVEIAYFGGSFTAIPRQLMHQLLTLAQTFVDDGRVDGIRFSTRPDAVPDQLLAELAPYSISTIELGLQSLKDHVLTCSERGHTAAVAEDACRRIVAHGYTLCGQMMLGLPESSLEDELYTARRICQLGAKETRIYPTVVLSKTPLAQSMLCGEYTPLSVEQAVERAAAVLEIFEDAGVRCLRIGLCENEGLHGQAVLGGAHHPALGEMVYAQRYQTRMRAALMACGEKTLGATAIFSVAPGMCSQAIGQRKSNVRALCRDFGLLRVIVQENAELTSTQLRLDGVCGV
jgi:histone acetyltransferase (RNA polymerase elongator complex component)